MNFQLYSPHQAPLTASTMESTPQSQSKLDKRKMYCTGCTSQDKQQKLSLKKSNHHKLFLKSGVNIFHTRGVLRWVLGADSFVGRGRLSDIMLGLTHVLARTSVYVLFQFRVWSLTGTYAKWVIKYDLKHWN